MVTMRPPYFFDAVRAMLSPSNVMTSGYLSGDGSDQPAVLRQSVAEHVVVTHVASTTTPECTQIAALGPDGPIACTNQSVMGK